MPPYQLGPDAKLPSMGMLEDDEQEFGKPVNQFHKSADLLKSEQAVHQQNAMEMLQKALNNQPTISPTQGIAAALLAAIPTLGGALIGRSVGKPNLPEGVFFRGIEPGQFNREFGGSGQNAGGLAGSQIGQQAADNYIGGMVQERKEQIPIYKEMARQESDMADDLGRQAAQYDLHGLDAEERKSQDDIEFDRQKQLIGLEEASRIRVANSKTTAQKIVEKELADPAKKAAYDRISAGTASPDDSAMLSADALDRAYSNRRSTAYGQSVVNSQNRFNTLQSYAEDADTVATSPLGKDPKLNAKRAEIVANRNKAAFAVSELANSYDRTSGAFLGIDRAKEAALAATIYQAARAAANTGAQLTLNEKPLVDAASAPQVDVNGFSDFFHRYLTGGGDPAEIVKSVGSVMDKGFNAELSGYGRVFKEYAPQESSDGLPQVGGTFQGKKVISVKKVG